MAARTVDAAPAPRTAACGTCWATLEPLAVDYAPFEVLDYAPFELPAFEPWPALVLVDARELAAAARRCRESISLVRTGEVNALAALQAAAESVGELAATALSQLNLAEADDLMR